MRSKASRAAHVLLLAAACLVVYANGYQHAFNLDSGHVIVDNPAVRSLANIPSFFRDAGTFSVLRDNVDYRPVLTASYALDYRLVGYEMWGWHLTQVLLHVVCVVGLYALCLRLLARSQPAVLGEQAAWIAFAAAAVFAVHPTASGVVNYQSARSSLLTAAFLLPALLAYTRAADEAGYRKTMWGAAALFGLALFTKVEAVAAIAVFFSYDCWQTARRRGHAASFASDAIHTLNATTLRRLWPVGAIAVAYWLARSHAMADYPFEQTSRRMDVSHLDYLRTQVVACWYYVRHWFAPVGLVADHGSYPVQRSFLGGEFLAALGAWLVVGAWLLASWRRRPQLLFVALSALALISPTSSLVPLAEMVNEHRPYLPLAVLSLAWMMPLGTALGAALPAAREAAAPRRRLARPALVGAYGLGLLALVTGLGRLTLQRNEVFLTHEAYWKDVVEKAPSARAYVNYGRVFMKRADYATALDYYRKSLALAPYWHITHINLGVCLDQLGETARAREHYDRAVEYDRSSGAALTWRGQHFLARGECERARTDFEASLQKGSLERYRNFHGLASAHACLGNLEQSSEHSLGMLEVDSAQAEQDLESIAQRFAPDAGLAYLERLEARIPGRWWLYKGLATAWAHRGDARKSFEYTRRCIELDAERTELAIKSIVDPYFASAQSPSWAPQAEAGLAFLELIAARLPDRWWVFHNRSTLLARLGRKTEAEAAWRRGNELLVAAAADGQAGRAESGSR